VDFSLEFYSLADLDAAQMKIMHISF